MTAQIPAHSAPFVDTKSGLISQQWYEFLTDFARDLRSESAARATAIEALEAEIAGGDSTVMLKAANLSDVDDVAEARDNLGMAWVKLASGDATSVASVDMELTAGYRGYTLFWHHAWPASGTVTLMLRLSVDGGATYAGSGYSVAARQVNESGAVASVGGGSTTSMSLGSASNGTNEGTSGRADLHIVAGQWPRVTFQAAHVVDTGTIVSHHTSGAAFLEDTSTPTHARLLFSAGDIASISWTLLGLR